MFRPKLKGEIEHDEGLAKFLKKYPDLFKTRPAIQKNSFQKDSSVLPATNDDSEKIKAIGKKALQDAQKGINMGLDLIHGTKIDRR